jgi:hypothetical protein
MILNHDIKQDPITVAELEKCEFQEVTAKHIGKYQ